MEFDTEGSMSSWRSRCIVGVVCSRGSVLSGFSG